MVCHGNYAISHNQHGLSLEDNIFLHLNDAIERIGIHKQMSKVLKVSLITHWVVFFQWFSLIFKFSLIFMNMHMR